MLMISGSTARDCGITKAEVRSLSAMLGISVAERPSTPCMATRLPYGAQITAEILERIEKGEELIKSLGYRNVRLRVHGDLARIEVDREDIPRAASQAQKLSGRRKEGRIKFRHPTLRGCLN